jgi:hypothetical protein
VTQGAANHTLDAPSQELFKVGGQAPWEPWRRFAGNVNQEVHVALWRRFSPRYRAENPDISRPMASCQPQDFIPMFSDLAGVHNSILSLGRAAIRRDIRRGSFRRRGAVLRHLAGQPRGTPGPGGCAEVRITVYSRAGLRTTAMAS